MSLLNKIPYNILKVLQKNNLIIIEDVPPLSALPTENKKMNKTTIIHKIETLNQEVKEKQELSLVLREQLLQIKEKEFDLKVAKHELLNNKIFTSIKNIEQLKLFMQWHVFAVWDFMSLIKRLQKDLTCTSLPWLPNKYNEAARLVNEIVLGEESDETPLKDGHMSHFDLYLQAMDEINADTSQIKKFISFLQTGVDYKEALDIVKAPNAVKEFVKYTIETALNANTYQVLGSFFHGRENIIPDMFTNLLSQWNIDTQKSSMFVYYVKRHIEVDSGEHGPASEKIMNIVTESEPEKIIQLLDYAIEAVNKRQYLWTQLNEEIKGLK